jgi:SNF family Na+-dependent transporter
MFSYRFLSITIIGAFIIPYFCIYFLIGTPLFFLEMSLGQFTSRGSATAFKMSRMFKGIETSCINLVDNVFHVFI